MAEDTTAAVVSPAGVMATMAAPGKAEQDQNLAAPMRVNDTRLRAPAVLTQLASVAPSNVGIWAPSAIRVAWVKPPEVELVSEETSAKAAVSVKSPMST